MSVPRLLLLTGVPPGRVHIGPMFLRDLCLMYPHDRLWCLHQWPLPDEVRSDELSWLPMFHMPGPAENFPGGSAWKGRLLRTGRMLKDRYLEATALPRFVDQAVTFAKTHGIELIWATLHTPTTYRAARAVAERLGVPLVVTVWDPPRYKMLEFGVDRLTLRRLILSFGQTIRSAQRCGVASEPMRQEYEGIYGTRCVVMIYPQRRPGGIVRVDSPPDTPFVIGYSGSIYALEEWRAFVGALASTNWTIAGRRVVLKVLSSNLPIQLPFPAHIELLGWRDPIEAGRLLSQMDAAYLPYWLSASYQEAVRLCFPGKLAAYVAARTPVFYHGPQNSSVMRFMDRFPVGVPCHSLNERDIVSALARLVADSGVGEPARLASDQAYHDELNPTVFRQRFAELIGIGEQQLLPLPPSS